MMLWREEPSADCVSSVNRCEGETRHTDPTDAAFWLDVEDSFRGDFVHDAKCKFSEGVRVNNKPGSSFDIRSPVHMSQEQWLR